MSNVKEEELKELLASRGYNLEDLQSVVGEDKKEQVQVTTEPVVIPAQQVQSVNSGIVDFQSKKQEVVSEERVLVPTSLEQLKKVSSGFIIELPGFDGDEPFVALLKRPSIMKLASEGKIPNELLQTANELFTGEAMTDTMDEQMLAKTFSVANVLCQEAFVKPTYNEISEAGLELTDEQMIAVFNFVQAGVRKLKSFRQE